MVVTQPGDLVQLASRERQFRFVRLVPGETVQTHRGVLAHDDILGKPYGSRIFSHTGMAFVILPPSMADALIELKRATQIVYPKDLGYILLKLSVSPGQTVVEAGSGSGGMTVALANAVGPQGRVVTYEIRPEMSALARRNLERFGLAGRVEFKVRDIAEGFDERDVSALFMDVPRPYDYIPQVRATLRGGGFFGSVVPTTNQVSDLLVALQRERFGFVEVCENLQRYYKPVPARLRPVDRMVAHTAYLVFGRPVEFQLEEGDLTPEEDGPGQG